MLIQQAQLIHITWLFRKGALTLCILILFYTYYSYKDEQMENYKMLRRIECQLNCLYEVNQPVRKYFYLYLLYCTLNNTFYLTRRSYLHL